MNSYGEETIIARVGEGIVTTVGSSQTHKDVLENPDRISKTVLGKGLDAGTAFEILSIDIADVDVGREQRWRRRMKPSRGKKGNGCSSRAGDVGSGTRNAC